MAADRDLLFGLLALQNGLIDQDQLLAAFRDWTRDRTRPLAEILVARGDLEGDDRSAVENLAARHLRKHGNDPERSLASFPMGSMTRQRLAALADPQLDATLQHAPSQPAEPNAEQTVTMSVGSATAEGQRFRVLRPHARGGLGAVFVALDDELHREVALKQILDSHADDPTSRQRFLLEAEITGGLEHPGIVPVYGLGCDRAGRPFYAMRFIRGDSLKEAIEQFHQDRALQSDPERRSLALRKLLRRFLDVCNAIEYAHSRGVLHRDLKPGNIIIGKHGETLVVDWGLAKAQGKGDRLEPTGERPLVPSSASGSADTLPGAAIGTPAYMSPEQARGDLEALGPASDVYSLGATLYCLLTGKPPLEGSDLGALLRAVEKGAFPPPSKLNPRIDRALEAVCRKAMANRPEERYGSARALAEDIERWIADEAVTAYRDPLTTRLTRWGRRHRSLATALGVLLVTGFLGVTLGALLINRERSRAEANFRQARAAVDEYFTTVSESKLLNVPGLQPLRKELLDAARRYYEAFLREHGEDASVRSEAASASFRVGWVSQGIGETQQALASYRTATRLYEQLMRSQPDHLEFRRLAAIGHGAQGLALGGLDQVEAALEEHRKALAIREGIAAADPEDSRVQIDLARTLRNIGDLYRAVGKPEVALQEWDRAIAIARPLLDRPLPTASGPVDLTGRNNLSAIVREDLGSLLLDRAEVFREGGRKAEASASWNEGRGLFEALVRETPEDLSLQARLADCYANGYSLAYDLGRFPEAHEWIVRSVKLREAMAAANPSVVLYRRAWIEGLLNLGYIEQLLHQEDRSLATCRRAIELAESLLKIEPESAYTANLLCQGLTQSASLLCRSDRAAEGLSLARRGAEILEPIVAQQPEKVFHRSSFSNTLRALGRAEEANGHIEAAHRAYARAAEVDHALADRYPGCRYNEACALALLVRLAPLAEREHLAARAVATLKQAFAEGYSNLENMKLDPDLDTIRSRPEFKGLLGEIEQARDRVAGRDSVPPEKPH
jgi:serine/threonine-protein kinase